MKATEGRVGRIFVIRLEDGDVVPDCVEEFAARKKIAVAYAIMIGGIGGGQVVSGPRHTEERPPDPLYLPVDGVHEVAGVGILAPDGTGKPVLHIHAALGRAGSTLTGCLRPGVTTWLVGEVVLVEIIGADVARLVDKASGFELLEVKQGKSKKK
jgi:predicted DNA-binding protein with PD1-like motif